MFPHPVPPKATERMPETSEARSMRDVPMAPAVALRKPVKLLRERPAKVEVPAELKRVAETPPEKELVAPSPRMVVVEVLPTPKAERDETPPTKVLVAVEVAEKLGAETVP